MGCHALLPSSQSAARMRTPDRWRVGDGACPVLPCPALPPPVRPTDNRHTVHVTWSDVLSRGIPRDDPAFLSRVDQTAFAHNITLSLSYCDIQHFMTPSDMISLVSILYYLCYILYPISYLYIYLSIYLYIYLSIYLSTVPTYYVSITPSPSLPHHVSLSHHPSSTPPI
jgi:hypothetical protein